MFLVLIDDGLGNYEKTCRKWAAASLIKHQGGIWHNCIIVQLVYELSGRPLAYYFPTLSACSDHMRSLLAQFQRPRSVYSFETLEFVSLARLFTRFCPGLPAEEGEVVYPPLLQNTLGRNGSIDGGEHEDAAGYEKSDGVLLVRMLGRKHDT